MEEEVSLEEVVPVPVSVGVWEGEAPEETEEVGVLVLVGVFVGVCVDVIVSLTVIVEDGVEVDVGEVVNVDV